MFDRGNAGGARGSTDADLATAMIYVTWPARALPEAAELLEERLFGQKSGQK